MTQPGQVGPIQIEKRERKRDTERERNDGSLIERRGIFGNIR